jgi:uncharacterized protein YceK
MAWREHDPLDATFTAVADTVFLPLFAHVEVG